MHFMKLNIKVEKHTDNWDIIRDNELDKTMSSLCPELLGNFPYKLFFLFFIFFTCSGFVVQCLVVWERLYDFLAFWEIWVMLEEFKWHCPLEWTQLLSLWNVSILYVLALWRVQGFVRYSLHKACLWRYPSNLYFYFCRYIEFYDVMSVPMAIALSGQPLLGVPVMVKPSEAEKNLVQSSTSVVSEDRKLYVGNLPVAIKENQLRQVVIFMCEKLTWFYD